MKEAFWGVLIVMLGLLGIVIIQVFQNVTVTNDQTYYLLKEATEASMLDSIDLAYYRTKGKIKIIKDKFVENLARRFAESANINDNYDIIVHDIIEEPPKISLSIGTYVFSLKGDTFNIGQSISSIIESKYNNKTIGEDPVTPPECKPGDPGCGETPPEPPEDPDDDKCPVCEAGDPNCSPALECIPGDLRFKNWGDVTVTNATCPEDTLTNKSRAANYQTCECGKWKDASDSVPSVITKTSTNYTYTWHFLKTSAIRTLDFTSTKKGSYSSCIPITGVSCPDTYVGIGKSTTITPTYMPSNTSQRTLTWSINNSSIATIQYPTGTIGPTGKSIATVIGKKEGTAIVTVKTIKGHTDTCKVNVIDPDSLKCANVEMDTESSAYGSTNIKPAGLTYAISSTSIASMNKDTGKITSKDKAGTIYYTVSAPGYNTPPKCSIKITAPPPPSGGSTGCTPGSIYVDWDTGNRWPNRKGPKLCPQDFEYIEHCIPNPYGYGPPTCSTSMKAQTSLGMSYDKVSYCGYYGGYTYPNKYHYDKTETRNSMLITNGSESINESNHTYSVRFNHTFNYEGWNTAVGPYTRGVSTVSKNYTITGSLYDRKDSTCGQSGTSTVFLYINCPLGGLIEDSSAIQVSVDRYGVTSLKDSTATWSISGTTYLKFSGASSGTSAASSVKVQGIKVGTAQLSYKVQKTDGSWAYSSNTCSIPVYPKCSDTFVSGPSIVNRYQDGVRYNMYPSFGGESAWSTSNSTVLALSNTTTFMQTVNADPKKAGTATVTAIRRIDGCKKTMSVTVKPVYKCPSGYPEPYPGNNDYCYSTSKRAPFSCQSSYPYMASNGYCYRSYQEWYSSYGYATHVSPSVCSPWYTGMVYATRKCYYLKHIEAY